MEKEKEGILEKKKKERVRGWSPKKRRKEKIRRRRRQRKKRRRGGEEGREEEQSLQDCSALFSRLQPSKDKTCKRNSGVPGMCVLE